MRLRLPLIATLALAVGFAHGQAYTDLHDFAGGTDGSDPLAGVTFDAAGNMYGTTNAGGVYGASGQAGMVWEITKAGVYKDLHDFGNGNDGASPYAGVTFDAAGNMYGTASEGGLYGGGILWEITAAGVYQDLHDFGNGSDGASPCGGVTFDATGNMYGTTLEGGAYGEGNGGVGNGIVWEVTAAGAYKDLHDFGNGSDGANPASGVTLDAAGDLYGTAHTGGAYGQSNGGSGDGMVWELTVAGVYKDLHDFGNDNDGANPWAGVTLDPAGNIYGTCAYGGLYGYDNGGPGDGIVWEITTAGVYKTLHDFGRTGLDGNSPFGGVTFDAYGNLFGTTDLGGQYETDGVGDGMVWEITAAGTYQDVHDFGNGTDGQEPGAGVTFDAVGNMYGTTEYGGQNGATDVGGMAWEITASSQLVALTLSPSAVTGGTSSTGTVTLSLGAPTGGLTVTLSSSSASAEVPPSVTVPAGHTSATFSVVTAKVAQQSQATITAVFESVKKPATLTIDPPPVSSVTLNPTSVVGGTSSTGTVTIASSAPAGGVAVTLASSSADATVPSSVAIAAGATSATFTVKTIAVAANVAATISASDGPGTRTAALTVEAPVLTSLVLSPPSVLGGASSTGTVTVNAPAPSAGVSVTLSSDSSSASVPSQVTISSGKSSATFTLMTTPVGTNSRATITATTGAVSKTAAIGIYAPTLTGLSLSPTSVIGGTSSIGTVTINAPAPTAGILVTLANNSSVAAIPSSVTVESGKTSATFTVTTIPVATNMLAAITAKAGSVSKSAGLTIEAPALTGLSLSPTSVIGGTSSTGTVTISSSAPTAGFSVKLSSSSSAASVPSSVTITSGKTSATFTVTTSPVGTNTNATVSAKSASVLKTAVLTIEAPVLTKFTVNPSSITGAGTVSGTLTLSGPAASGGASIKITSSSTYATVTSPVVIASGTSTTNFTIKITKPASTVTAMLTATFGGVTKTATITINP
jgi:hypothetical protein